MQIEPHAKRWQLRSRSLRLGQRTLVMGVVNLTSDSFSDGGEYLATEKAIAHALALLDEGADLLDLGAESTRPGSLAGARSATVSSDQEQARLLPAIEGILRERPGCILSIDTYKAATAHAALSAGAEIINDVSGLNWDETMAQICVQSRCGVVLMHTRGRPHEWQTQVPLAKEEIVPTVYAGLAASLNTALTAGIDEEAIVLDAGYGFGKRMDENYTLLARQAELLQLGRPLLAGVSRKSFLGGKLASLDAASLDAADSQGTDRPEINTTDAARVESVSAARETASIAAMVTAILNGASIVRVHRVRAALAAAAIADAVLRGKDTGV